MKTALRIGKSGITETVIKEINAQLTKKKQVTVKFLGSIVANKKDFLILAEELSNKTNAKIVKKVGHTAIYQKTFKKQTKK